MTDPRRIAVVVTTFNRPDYLRACLESLATQSLPTADYEVIIVDDCSEIDQRDVVAEFNERLTVDFIRHEVNKGLGEARNTGVAAVTAPFVILFDDDDIAGRDMVAEHLRSHLEHPGLADAVLGYTGFGPDLDVNNVTFAVTQTLQTYLSYGSLQDGQELPWHCAWGGRSSFKTQLLRDNPFAVRWLEDMELAWRLREVGLRVFYNAKATQFLTVAHDVESFAGRSRSHGQAQYRVSKLHRSLELEAFLAVDQLDNRLASVSAQIAEALDILQRFDAVPRPELDALEVTHNGSTVAASALLDAAYRIVFDEARIQGAIAAREEMVVRYQPSGKKVLFIDAVLPWYDRAAGAQRCFEMVKIMVAEGHDVTFLARYGVGQERYAQELQDLGVTVYATDPERLAYDGITVDAPRLDVPSILRNGQFDLAIIEFYYIAEQYLPLIRRYSPQTKVVVDSVDIHYVRERRQAAISGDAALAQASEQTKAREAAAYGQADAIIAVTEVDRGVLRALVPHVDCFVVSMINRALETAASRKGRNGIVFVGNFGHTPNVDGVSWFVDEVLPIINKVKPNLALTVIGNGPPERLLGKKNVVCTGWVESFDPYLASSLVSVAPLRYGSGVKGKIVDALSVGLPVVTTTVGAEGMNLASDTSLIADDAEGFAAHVLSLIEDAELWQTASDNGRQHVDTHFGVERARLVLNRALYGADQIVASVNATSLNDVAAAVVSYARTHVAGDGSLFTAAIADRSLTEEEVFNALASALVAEGFDLDHIPDVSVSRA